MGVLAPTRGRAAARRQGPLWFEADLFLYGLRVGVALIRDRRWLRALRYLIQPVP
jgi:hypothetical protein